jgi:hypothetical protein
LSKDKSQFTSHPLYPTVLFLSLLHLIIPIFRMPKLILIRFISVQREIHVNKHVWEHIFLAIRVRVGMGERKRVVSADDKILCQLLKGFRFSDISETFITTCFGHLAERIPKNYTHFSFMICYYAWAGRELWGHGKHCWSFWINISPCSLRTYFQIIKMSTIFYCYRWIFCFCCRVWLDHWEISFLSAPSFNGHFVELLFLRKPKGTAEEGPRKRKKFAFSNERELEHM